MSQENPIRIFVTHIWERHDDYVRVFEYLESARNFFYRNHSNPDVRPEAQKEAMKEALRKQIAPAEAVIALSSLYAMNQDLSTFQVLYAKASQKPVILLKELEDLADEVVEWDERALVDAVKRQARHEDTTRWDTIEFKLEDFNPPQT